MISLKRPRYLIRSPKIRARIRSIRPTKKPKPKRPKKRPGRKRKEGDTKENETNKKDNTIAMSQ